MSLNTILTGIWNGIYLFICRSPLSYKTLFSTSLLIVLHRQYMKLADKKNKQNKTKQNETKTAVSNYA